MKLNALITLSAVLVAAIAAFLAFRPHVAASDAAPPPHRNGPAIAESAGIHPSGYDSIAVSSQIGRSLQALLASRVGERVPLLPGEVYDATSLVAPNALIAFGSDVNGPFLQVIETDEARRLLRSATEFLDSERSPGAVLRSRSFSIRISGPTVGTIWCMPFPTTRLGLCYCFDLKDASAPPVIAKYAGQTIRHVDPSTHQAIPRAWNWYEYGTATGGSTFELRQQDADPIMVVDFAPRSD